MIDLEIVGPYAVFTGIAVGAGIVWLRNGLTPRIKRHIAEAVNNGDGNGHPGILQILLEMREKQGQIKQMISDDREDRVKRQNETDEWRGSVDQCLDRHGADIEALKGQLDVIKVSGPVDAK